MKAFLTTVLLSSSLFGFAQQSFEPRSFDEPILNKTFEKKTVDKVPFRTYGSQWYNLHDDMVTKFLVDGSTSASPFSGLQMFPDSTIYLGVNQVTSQPVSAWIHGAADVITPSMTPSNWINDWGEVIIDSVDIWYSYVRNTPSNITDTLFVSYLENTYRYAYFDDGDQIPEAGEFLHLNIPYDYMKNDIPDSILIRRDTVLLTEADSSSYITSLQLDVNDTIPGGGQYGVYTSFKPGYTWTKNNDTITKYNSFYLISREQALEEQPSQLWNPQSVFSSYVLPYDVRYNDAGSFNGGLITTMIYSETFSYEHHYIWYKLTSNEIGMKDISTNVKNVGTYPNPAVNSTNVAFSLDAEEEVVLRVVDLTGRTVLENNYGKLTKGQHIQTLDLSRLKTGNYSVSVNGSAKIITVLK